MAFDGSSPTEETRACPNCGSSVLAKWAFCRHCGIALNSFGAQWEPIAEPLGLRSRRKLSDAALDASQSPSALSEPRFRQDHLEEIYRRGKQEMNLEKSALHFIPAEVEKQIIVLEQRVEQITEGDSNRIGALNEQMKRLEEGLQAIRVSRDILDERRRKERKLLEGSFTAELERATSERRQLESSLQERGRSILDDCRADMIKEQEQKGSVQEEYVHEMGEEVQRLHVLLEKHHSARVERGEQILVKLEADFQKVHHDIETEQKLRFEAEGMMLRMVEDVCGRLHGEIDKERLQREAVQNKLLGLLEDTCTQIENSFSYLAKSKG